MSDREARLVRLSRAVLLALLLALGFATYASAGLGDSSADAIATDGPRLGGDYAAFYAAGSIVWDGDLDSLYDPARQQQAQEELGIDGYLAFAYAPHVAFLYAPISALPFQLSYFVHTMLMAGAFFGAVMLLSPIVPLLARWRLPILAAGFTFYPLSIAVGGGQNAALSVLGFAAIWRGLHDDREWLAGITAGLMMYRPQYALPAIGVMFLSRHWRAVAWAVATTALTWAVTAAILGVSWLNVWFNNVLPFVELDAEVNAGNSISALGFLQAALGVDSTPALALGFALAGLVVVTLMFLWSKPDRYTLSDRMACLAVGVLLISPHTNFYDAALLTIAGAAVLARGQRNKPPVTPLGLVWVAVLVHPFTNFRATPLTIVVAAAFLATVIATTRPLDPSEPAPTAIDEDAHLKLVSHA